MLPLPLSMLRAVEIGRGVAVGHAGRLLADLGAEVIKIEDPAPAVERGSEFQRLHRNKLSLALDYVDLAGLLGPLLNVSEFLIAEAEQASQLAETAKGGALGSNARLISVLISRTDVPSAGLAAAGAALAALFSARASGEGQEVGDAAAVTSGSTRRGSESGGTSDWLTAAVQGQIEPAFIEPVAFGEGVAQVEGVPFRFAATPVHVRLPAPGLGQHNAYVLHEVLGIAPKEA